MAFPLSPESISRAVECPIAAVAANWPLIYSDLMDMSIGSVNTCIAVLATVAVETAHTFKPIHEYGSNAYFEAHYQGRMGNVNPGDGAKYHGRGFVQTTGEANYERDGKLIGVDLVSNPDKALDPGNAALLLVAYFWDHHISAVADMADWPRVRRMVNGGTNGLQDFLLCVKRLQGELLNVPKIS